MRLVCDYEALAQHRYLTKKRRTPVRVAFITGELLPITSVRVSQQWEGSKVFKKMGGKEECWGTSRLYIISLFNLLPPPLHHHGRRNPFPVKNKKTKMEARNAHCYRPYLRKTVFFSFSFFLSSSHRFTKIEVDPQVKTPEGKYYDVLFIGTGMRNAPLFILADEIGQQLMTPEGEFVLEGIWFCCSFSHFYFF
jgi:hypothetical protein